MHLEAEKDQLQLRIDNALDLILSSQIANQRLQKKIETDEKRLIEIDQEITSLKMEVMPIMPNVGEIQKRSRGRFKWRL